MLIAMCGIDGAGKTTQIKAIEEFLIQKQKKVYLTKQPTNWYRKDERVRDFLKGDLSGDTLIKELALFSASDKLRHWQTEIQPKMEEGYIVITDRYLYSAFAYFMNRGIEDTEWLRQINKFIPKPDITFFINTDPQIAYERIIKRDGESAKKEEKDVEFLKRVSDVFRNQPWGESKDYYVIDGNNNIDDVKKEIIDVINLKLEGQE